VWPPCCAVIGEPEAAECIEAATEGLVGHRATFAADILGELAELDGLPDATRQRFE